MSEAPPSNSDTASSSNTKENDLPLRWEVELEFVQSLANIQYLSYLVQNGYLKDEKFLNYLAYLTYWQNPAYSKHIVYPDCLYILTLLQNERFRIDISNSNLTNALFIDMVDYWKEEIYKDEKSNKASSSDVMNVSKSATNTPMFNSIQNENGNSKTRATTEKTSMSPTSTEG